MKILFQMLLVFLIGPGVGLALAYSAGAFIAWDWWWAAHTSEGARFFFVVFGGFAAFLGFAGGGSLAISLD
jgi:hypothetical protein